MNRQIVVLSGMAGAGKTTAARALEDLGFFVVDNLPPQLIDTLIALSDSSGAQQRKLAFVIDAREARFLAEFGSTWDRLRARGVDLSLVFLDANDDTLVRRFQETRRRHPLDVSPDGARAGVLAAITRERALLADVSMRADVIIDTRELSVHALKGKIAERFGQDSDGRLLVTVESFGFKHGLPQELDVCFDVRFLPNPFFIPELRPHNGTEAPVAAFVLEQPDAQAFLQHAQAMVAFLLPRYAREGKAYLTVAIGCTGGRHRSPAIAVELAARMAALGYEARVVHRDIALGAEPTTK